MKRITLTALLWVASLWMFAQSSFNMTLNGNDTTTLCTGTLYDNGGSTGSYSNYSSDYFYIDPAGGGTLSLTFTSFGMYHSSDKLYIYDGIGPTATYLGYYTYSSLPNSGNPIVLSSGKATIYFTSNYYGTSSGFAMNWSAASGNPTASFNASNLNPPVNVGVSFTSTSTNKGNLTWDFGDGTFSTDDNPVHKYTSPGTYQAKLINTNCLGADTSSVQNILVMANPVYTITPDSLYASVNCGNTATQSFTVNQTGGGTMYYSLSGKEVGVSPYIFNENFESGLGNFSVSPSAYSGFNAFAAIGGAAAGNGSVVLSNNSGYFSGLTGDFPVSQPTEFSYYVKHSNSSDNYGFVALTDGNGTSSNALYYCRIGYNWLYVYTGSGTYSYQILNGQWNQIEVKNINWSTKTFDLYLNNTLQAAGLSFNNTGLTGVSTVHLFNTSSYTFYYDAVKVKTGTTTNLTFSPTNGVLSSGNSNTINVSVPTTGKSAGTYEYEVKFATNSSTADSVKVLPFVVDVIGSAGINMSKTCSNFGQVYSGLGYSDSIMIHNSGCDTLDISNITSTDADFTTVGSLNIPPYDTAWLYLNFSPSAIQAYTDTLYLTTNDVDTIICLSANAVGAPIITTDSSSYHIFSNGCNDSIPFNFEIINTGQSSLIWSIDQANSAQSFDDFETGSFSSMWQSTGSNVVASSCIVGSGTYGMIMEGTNRDSRTVPMSISAGDSITFFFAPGYSGSYTYCENPDGGEVVYLQYSLNGSNWIPFMTLYDYDPIGIKRFVVPAGAVSSSTQFRFYQPSHSGNGYDNYIIDDVRIGNQSNGRFSPSSGTTSAGDTTQVSGYIYVSGKSSGTYTETITINSNDPLDSVYTFNIDVTVIGEPEIVTPASCYAFGSVMNGLSLTDTLAVWNNGCDDLILTGTTSSNADITSTILTSTVSPGDTGWVEVTFAPTIIGSYSDSVFIQSNDTIGILCFTGTGLGAPDAYVNPDSIYVSFTSCDDSVTIPLTVYNTAGNVALDYEVEVESSNGRRKILAYRPYAYSTEYYNVKSILQQDPQNTIIEETSTSMSVLNAHLDSVDAVIIPNSSTYSSFWSLVSTELKAFCNDGGTVIILQQSSSTYSALDLIPNYISTYSATSVSNNHNPSHPIMQGVSTTVPYQNYALAVGFSGAGNILLSTSSTAISPAVVSTHTYGTGKVIQIGYDYYTYSTDTEKILKNAVVWGATPSYSGIVSATPDSGAVATGDSVVVNLTISALGLSNGRVTNEVVVTTNDPLNPEIVIPLVIDINGSAQILLDTATCVSFTNVLQGATATDSVMVTNVGCDTLHITGFTASGSEFGISGLPLSIAPGDSLPVMVDFTPLTVGSFSDTIILLNNDTSVTICANGTSAGAAVLFADTDTLEVTLNKCKVIKNVIYKIGNTGLGNMTYGLSIGDYSASSQISYNASQATTNHIFNGVPSSDTLMVRVILKGDYDNYYERAYLRIDNYNYGYVYDNNKPYHTLDTVDFLIWGANVLSWTSDGTLDIELQNSYDVDGSTGSFHRVEVFLPAQINWASIIGTGNGNVAANSSINKTILFNAASLGVGTYHTTMKITTNAPGAPLTNVPLKLNVVSAPEISFSDSCLYYPLTLVGDTTSKQLTIYNDGCTDLNVSNITSTNNAFKLSPNSGVVAVGDSLIVTVNFVPTQANFYNASLIVTSNDSTKVICLSGLGGVMPVADFAVNYENGCLGEVAFVNSSSNSPTSYIWNMGDGNAYSTKDVTHYYAKPGTYNVILKVTNNSGKDSISKTVTVNPLYVDFSMTNDTVLKGSVVNFYDSSIVATAWRWNFGDGTTSNVQNPSNTYNVLGKYTIELEVDDANNCTRKTTKELYVVNHIGIGENAFSNLNLTVYPNPSNTGRFTLEATQNDLTDYGLTVSDLNGKIIWRGVPSSIAETEIDLSGFSKGMYTLSVIKEGRTIANKKLIVN